MVSGAGTAPLAPFRDVKRARGAAPPRSAVPLLLCPPLHGAFLGARLCGARNSLGCSSARGSLSWCSPLLVHCAATTSFSSAMTIHVWPRRLLKVARTDIAAGARHAQPRPAPRCRGLCFRRAARAEDASLVQPGAAGAAAAAARSSKAGSAHALRMPLRLQRRSVSRGFGALALSSTAATARWCAGTRRRGGPQETLTVRP